MPEPGYCEISCISAFESPTHPDSKNNTAPLRIRFYNRDDLIFDEQGTLVKTDLRIASVFHSNETTSSTFSREECDVSIPQYLSVTGRESRPILYLRCHLANSKIWKDPKALLPQAKSIVSCAGTFSHYEWETRNGTRIARLNINLDSIEFLLKTNPTLATTPTSNPTSPFAKSRFARKTGCQSPSAAQTSLPPSPSPAMKRKTSDSPDERSEADTLHAHHVKSSRLN
ncbi:hypothetical protein BC629DRAFT_36977 [Irpex lacteus]|nr:hypothetical protein BC629DRAFT_36977 [Irpex lacteus]